MSLKNKVLLTGRLGNDPETTALPDNTPVTKFRLATNETYKKQDGSKVTQTEWHNIKAFGKMAEICRDYATKGRLVQCEGRIATRKYTDQHNVDRYITEIIINDMNLLDSKPVDETAPANTEATADAPANNDVPF